MNYVQKIVFGSPGTGKSHYIDNTLLPSLGIDVVNDPDNVVKAVFHPEYTYGDFMVKVVPSSVEQKVIYKQHVGHFIKALSRAYKNIAEAHDKSGKQVADVKNVALVIDEINRGNSSAIFGTIFQLLDRDRDGWSSYYVSLNQMEFDVLMELMGVDRVQKRKNSDVVEYRIEGKMDYTNLENFQSKVPYLRTNFATSSVRIPFNMSIIGTMNTSDNSIYYMDSAFKRRWEWEYMPVDAGADNESRRLEYKNIPWCDFQSKLNDFIRTNSRYIRGAEDKQIGLHYIPISYNPIPTSQIKNKLMFYLWDSVFSRDKRPLRELLGTEDVVVFGQFANNVELFIDSITGR